MTQLLGVAARLPFLPYVGWDIVVDPLGSLKIIEGNHRSGVTILQIHQPLLRDPRIRDFFDRLP